MKKSIALIAGSLLAFMATQHPAQARHTAGGLTAVQLKKGMAAFNRHDYATAGVLLRLPAERGSSEAQAVLCYLHTYGRGVPQSYDEAAMWCHRSAEQGNTQGQYMLGLLYNKGHGVPENFVQAYKWLNLAAARASGPKRDFSYRIRDSVATKMSPNQLSKAQALSVEWRPELEQ
jgi:TPR repeat protein